MIFLEIFLCLKVKERLGLPHKVFHSFLKQQLTLSFLSANASVAQLMCLEVTRESFTPNTETLLSSATSKTRIIQNLFLVCSDRGFRFQLKEFLVRRITRI